MLWHNLSFDFTPLTFSRDYGPGKRLEQPSQSDRQVFLYDYQHLHRSYSNDFPQHKHIVFDYFTVDILYEFDHLHIFN